MTERRLPDTDGMNTFGPRPAQPPTTAERRRQIQERLTALAADFSRVQCEARALRAEDAALVASIAEHGLPYHRLPGLVAALRWTGENLDAVRAFVGPQQDVAEDTDAAGPPYDLILARRGGGARWVRPGDYIIRDGERHYACPDELFEHLYRWVDEPDAPFTDQPGRDEEQVARLVAR